MILARGKSCPAWEGLRELWPGIAWAKRSRVRARGGGEGRIQAERNQEQAFLPNWLMASCPLRTRLAHCEDSFSMEDKRKSGQWKNRKQTGSGWEAVGCSTLWGKTITSIPQTTWSVTAKASPFIWLLLAVFLINNQIKCIRCLHVEIHNYIIS